MRCLIAVGLILTKEDQILLMKRQNTGFGDGFWALPGGNVERRESLKRAACREGFEELNIIIDEKDIHFSSCSHLDTYFRSAEEALFFAFHVTSYTNEITNMEEEKCAELCFFSLNSLPKNLLEGTRKCIENFIEKAPYGELYFSNQNQQ